MGKIIWVFLVLIGVLIEGEGVFFVEYWKIWMIELWWLVIKLVVVCFVESFGEDIGVCIGYVVCGE